MLVFYFKEQVHRLTFDQSCSHYAMQDLPVRPITFVFEHPDLFIRTQKSINNGTLHLIARHQDRLTIIGDRELCGTHWFELSAAIRSVAAFGLLVTPPQVKTP